MKKLIYAGLVIAVLIAGGLVAFYGPLDDNNNNNDAQQPESSEQATDESGEQDAEEKIIFSEDGRTVAYGGEEGKDALSILKEHTEVATDSSDFGEFVTSINGVAADHDTEFWAFYVNGELASEGAGTYQSKRTDLIEWRIDKIEL